MARGTYISINTAKIGGVSAQVNKLGGELDTTCDVLAKLQNELSETQNILDIYFRYCSSDVIPTKRLKKQKNKMDEVVSLLAQAEQLAKDADNKLNTKTSALKLAVAAMSGLTAVGYTTAVSVITKALTGETDCGDGWTDVSAGYFSPLPGKKLKINSPYYRNGSGAYHGGVDFAAAEGTTLAAIQGGTVLFAGVEKLKNGSPAAGGNCILIKGTDGYYYYYAHLKTIGVKVGDTVLPGTIIGKTGKSTGTIKGMPAHLHLNIAIPVKSDIKVPAGSGRNGTGAAEWFGNKQAITIDPVKFLKEKGVL